MKYITSSRSTQFNCFSPPVMLATLVIESCLLVYTIWRYRLTVLTRLIVLSLGMLAIFQLSEYHVCTGFGLKAEEWSRLGYVAISTLPALGLHMLHILTNKPKRRLVVSGYSAMAGFIVYFLTYHAAFIGYKCTGNYVIFQIGARPAMAYALYYYGGLLTTIGLAMRWANELRTQISTLQGSASVLQAPALQNRLQTARALIVGYLIFLVPTALANSVDPASRRGIPSIMCGFAVLYALILTLYILPRSTARHRRPPQVAPVTQTQT